MRILSFSFTYFDHATGQRLPVPAGTVVVASPVGTIGPVNVTIITEGIFPETSGIPDNPSHSARVGITNIRGSAEYQLRPLVA